MIRLGMKNYNMILIKAAKILALPSGKIHKYEYLTDEEILPSDQQQIIEQAKFTYSLLGKAFEKQIKTIEDQGQKKVEALKDLKPKNKQNQSKVNLIINQGQQLYLMILLKEKA